MLSLNRALSFYDFHKAYNECALGRPDTALAIAIKAQKRKRQNLIHPHILECHILALTGDRRRAFEKKLYIDSTLKNVNIVDEDTRRYISYFTYCLFDRAFWDVHLSEIEAVQPNTINIKNVRKSIIRYFKLEPPHRRIGLH